MGGGGNPNHDDHGRFASGDGSPTGHAGNVQNKDGTFDRFKVTPTKGYMVGGAAEKGSRYTGRWTDPATGKLYVEKSTRVSSGVLAKSMGRMRNQISVWDLAKNRAINTGGTGQ